MKINGPNSMNFNPYKQQVQKQPDLKKDMGQDHIEISNKAKQLQENEKVSEKRAAHIQEIKKAIESGEYEVNPEVTAKKMMEFWSK